MDIGRAGNTLQSLWPSADFQQALGLPLFLYLHLFIVLEEPSRSPGPMHPTFSASQYPHLNSLMLMCLAWASKSNGLGSSPAAPSPTEWHEPNHFQVLQAAKWDKGSHLPHRQLRKLNDRMYLKCLLAQCLSPREYSINDSCYYRYNQHYQHFNKWGSLVNHNSKGG